MATKLIKERSVSNVPFGYKITGHVVSVDESANIVEAAKLLAKHNIGVVLVNSGQRLSGILSERDIVQRVVSKEKSAVNTKVREVMTSKVVTVNLDDGLNKIYSLMKKVKFRHLPVRKGDQVIGIVSNRDLMYLRKLKLKKA